MNIELKPAVMSDLDIIRNLYYKLLDSSEIYSTILRWKKGVYPSDTDWIPYIKNNEMYLTLLDGDLVGAVVLTKSQTKEYQNIPWQISVTDNEVSVIHLLAIDPEQQGKGLATVILDEAIKNAIAMKKRAVRLDAISTNIPAQKLYEKYGFINCGTQQLYYTSTGWTSFFMNIFYKNIIKSFFIPFKINEYINLK